MGHSFFKPAAEHLLKIIPDTNILNHTGYIVMSEVLPVLECCGKIKPNEI